MIQRSAMFVLLTMLCGGLAAQATGGGGTAPQPGPKIKWYEGNNNPVPGTVVAGAMRVPMLQFTFERYPSATTSTTLSRFGVNPTGNMSGSYIDQYELWHDVNGDGQADAGDVQIGQSYNGDFPSPTLPPVPPGQTVHILATLDLNAAAPVGEKVRLLTVQIPQTAYPNYFQFSPTETTFGELVTIGSVSFGGVLGGFQIVDPATSGIEVSDSSGTVTSGDSPAGDRDFGTVDLANMPTGYAQITVTNPGTANLTLGTPIITGTDAAHFVLDVAQYGTSLTPGSSMVLGVAFDASTVGSKLAGVELPNSAGQAFAFEISGIATSANGPAIANPTLPSATEGTFYGPWNLTVVGGVPAYTYSVVSGALPPGMQLNAAGQIEGTPTGGPGVFNFTVRVTDSVLAYSEQPLTLDVVGAPIPGPSDAGDGTSGGCAVGGGAMLPLLLPLLLAFRRRRGS